MSRRPNANADKAAVNQNVIKSLLKLPANRVCADCKRNKLPRWASWNLGIFVCIRCSGIHRGMGTHISRVKSVDLDSWTDEQLQSVVKWGNARANKYWEANLAPGHIPSEAKIENFIRTKYEAKRWVMEGGIPDPSTLDDEDDDNVPLKQVQEKLERKASASAPPAPPPQQRKQANFDIFGDDNHVSTPAISKPTSPPKHNKHADSASLLGLDFFAAGPTPSPRPSSVNSDPGKMTSSSSRPDLNRSILSLYASAPRAQQPLPQAPQSPIYQAPQSPIYQAPQSPIYQAPQSPIYQQHQRQSSSFSGMNDSFLGLSFGASSPPPPAQKPSPFANLTAGMKKTPAAAPQLSSGFFNPAPAKPTPAPAPSSLGDLFDFGAPAPTSPTPASLPRAQKSSHGNGSGSMSSFDTDAWGAPATSTSNAWGSSTPASATANAWATPAPTSASTNAWAPAPNAWAAPTAVAPTTAATNNNAWGASVSSNTFSSSSAWGGSVAPVSRPAPVAPPAYVNNNEDDWGHFSTGGNTAQPKQQAAPVKFDDDLFGNVWK